MESEAPAALQTPEVQGNGSVAGASISNQADVAAAGPANLPADDTTPQESVLEDSTMLQHQAVLSARLQNEPESSFSAQEDSLVDLPDVISTFKSTLVDPSGPIPGL